MFIRLDITPERDGRTDRRTDRIAVAITAVCTASYIYAHSHTTAANIMLELLQVT